jgi:hypothetical protein
MGLVRLVDGLHEERFGTSRRSGWRGGSAIEWELGACGALRVAWVLSMSIPVGWDEADHQILVSRN